MEQNQEKEYDYSDIESEEAEYSSKSDFSKAKIVYEAMQKCIEARGKEMKAGYYNHKISNDGSVLKIWVEDSRQVFIGSVEVLRGLLSPEIKNEKDYNASIKKYYEHKNRIKNIYVYTERLAKNTKGKILLEETKRKFIPEIGANVIVPDLMNPQMGKEMSGGWDNRVNAYWDDLVVLYDYIFAVLNDLINHLNYFKQSIAY